MSSPKVQDAKNRNTQLEKELAKKTKEEETQAKTILRKEGVIQVRDSIGVASP